MAKSLDPVSFFNRFLPLSLLVSRLPKKISNAVKYLLEKKGVRGDILGAINIPSCRLNSGKAHVLVYIKSLLNAYFSLTW